MVSSKRPKRINGSARNGTQFFSATEWYFIRFPRFKLHLRSQYGDGRRIANEIPPLPLNKTVVEVFADFLKYMLFSTKEYIRTTHANGRELWESLEAEIDFVLSHPNGWEGTGQSQMRQAAVLGHLVPNTPEGHARITFVTEREASLHFAIQDGILGDAMEVG